MCECKFEIIPGNDLKDIVLNKSNPEMHKYLKTFMPEVIAAIQQGKNIPIDGFSDEMLGKMNLVHIAH